MGWFDNEQQDGKPVTPHPSTAPPRPASASPSPTPTPTPTPTPSSGTGSTLGPQIHIDGTIVCEEDLTILGHVDGTIRAKGTLVIAKDADVRAKIDGHRVVVHGKVDGDVQGAERVVLGATAHLIGNIETPTLEIVEGAHFKGTVEMKQIKPEPAKQPAPSPAPAAKPPVAAKKEGAPTPDMSKPKVAPPEGPDTKPTQKQATS